MKHFFGDVTFGNLIIKNVPQIMDKYSEVYFKSSVSYRLSFLAEYALENNMKEIDYNAKEVDVV